MGLEIIQARSKPVSLVELLDDGEVKNHLAVAAQAFEAKNFGECLIECRKAIFVEFFSRYDIKWFEKVESKDWLSGFLTSAPYYSRNKEYTNLPLGILC